MRAPSSRSRPPPRGRWGRHPLALHPQHRSLRIGRMQQPSPRLPWQRQPSAGARGHARHRSGGRPRPGRQPPT
eukprot:5163384-Alexandrium_andersonii.AAC.1